MPGERERAVGLRLIVLYKLGKAAAEGALAALLAALLAAGLGARLHAFAEGLHAHLVGAWSLRLSGVLAEETTPGRLRLLVAALLADGAVTALEGWTLRRGFRWAPWLVVGTTAALLPFEVAELARGVELGRVLMLALNLAVVVYLARRARG